MRARRKPEQLLCLLCSFLFFFSVCHVEGKRSAVWKNRRQQLLSLTDQTKLAAANIEVDSEILQLSTRHGRLRTHGKRHRDDCEKSGLVKVSKAEGGSPKYEFRHACEPTPAADTVAWGVYDDEIMTTGWGDLTVKTSNTHPDLEQAFAAGFLEGVMTQERIWQISRVILKSHGGHAHVTEYFRAQDSFVRSKIAAVDPNSNEPHDYYWYNVALVIAQMDGVLEGYNSVAAADKHLDKFDMWLIQSDGDILDIERIPKTGVAPLHKKVRDMSKVELLELISLRGRCSALIKWVPGDDLLAAHTTWDDYAEMIRIYKHYELNYRHPSVKSHASSHSSYPGFVSSSDDFYILDTGLVVIETTLNILDETLYDLCDPNAQVLAWIRNMVANRMAGSAPQWIEAYSLYNSGTYNDQWMIVDYNLFSPEISQLKPNTVWIVEQIPGFIAKQDVSDLISQETYWASYNRPFFDEVNKRSMYHQFTDTHGEMFSYRNCPRAKIFQRDHKWVNDVETMKKLMMQNKWQTDPLSQGCPGNAIASRFDIDAPNCSMNRVANGATDSKVTSWKWRKARVAVSVGGPTHDNQEPFRWDVPEFSNEVHEGQPTVWNFDWQVMKQASV